MRLSELAFANFLYDRLTSYDDSYRNFQRITNASPDLSIARHRRALLAWLNKWGCRQFALEHHELASGEILRWHNQYGDTLFPGDRDLWELTELELSSVGTAYESLSNRTASYRTRNGNRFSVSFGPTGAAKILFAIRPRALVPWDDSVRNHLEHDGSPASYLSYLKHVKSMLKELAMSCQGNGFQLIDLPQQLGRPDLTLPKLIDEYYWVTITKKCSPPDSDTFQRWANWSRP
jgi:hypothetical protein